jgi:Effector protein
MTLRIDGAQIYKGNAQLVPSSGNDADGFESAVKTALERIRSTEVGGSLLSAIEGATNEVLIVKPGQDVGNTCVQSDQSPKACIAACYLEVLDIQSLYNKIGSLTKCGQITAGHPAVKKFMKFYFLKDRGGRMEEYTFKQGKGEYPIAHKSQDEAHTTDSRLREKMKWFMEEVPEAVGSIEFLQRGLVAYHIMDHLTPGPGTGAWVVWDPLLDRVHTDLPAERRAAWMDRPPWIALAHELIHGWRLVTGRCVFRPGRGIENYYEEAMTVGLPPYDQCRFTENRLRHFKALPLRNFYGESTLNQSSRAALKHGSATSRIKLSITVVGSGPNDPLVFDYDIRSASKPDEIVTGETDAKGHATAQWMIDGEIRFRGFGAFGRVETQWQKIVIGRYMTLQFGRYRFICEPP